MLPAPDQGRIFEASRPVRMGDVRPCGVLRLDGLTRYTQDVSNDDTTDATLDDDLAWVVRSTVVEVLQPARFGEGLSLRTFASGVGRSWAERRIDVLGDGGAEYRVASLWIHVDAASGRPRRLSQQFFDLYGQAARDRQVSARLRLEPFSPEYRAEQIPWLVRRADLDLQGHVNNSVYWQTLEERIGEVSVPYRVRMEYQGGVGLGDDVVVLTATDGQAQRWWWRVGDQTAAAAAVSPID